MSSVARWTWPPSSEDRADRLAEVDFKPLSTGDFELVWVETKLMQNGGVNVGDIVSIFDGVEADFVGLTVHDTPLDAPAGQPGAEALRVVVAAVGLRAR